MTIWEKAILNMQKGTQKITATAAIFSDRVKAEIDIARLRIRLDEIQAMINEQHRYIGKKIVDLKNRSELPKTTEQLMKDEDIVAAMADIESRERDKADVLAEIESRISAFKPAKKTEEEAPL